MITLAQAKLHCRIDGTDEDQLLEAIIAAAEDFVSSQTGLDFGADPETPPPARARSLLLLLIGDLYQNREATAETATKENRTTTLLMNSLRRHSLGVRPLAAEPETGA